MDTYTVTYVIQNTRTGHIVEDCKSSTDTTQAGAMISVAQLMDHEDSSWTRILSITVTVNHKEN